MLSYNGRRASGRDYIYGRISKQYISGGSTGVACGLARETRVYRPTLGISSDECLELKFEEISCKEG